MYLRTRGKPKRTTVRYCKDAVRHYGLSLLGKRLYHLVEIEIFFSANDMDRDVYAYCDWNDNNYKARDFTIQIRPTLSRKQTLLALAHEMVHVKQYAKGELKDYARTSRCKWKDQIIEHGTIGYWDLPWEIEARQRERDLYMDFITANQE